MKYKLIKSDKILYSKKRRALKQQKLEVSASYLELVEKQRFFISDSIKIVEKIKIPHFDMNSILPKIPKVHIPNLTDSMLDAISKVNKALTESIRIQMNLIEHISANTDFSKLRETISLLEKSLKLFIQYCEQHKMSMTLEYFSDYYDIYLGKNEITDEDIYVTFKKHYSAIKKNLIENDFYHPKKQYITRILENFDNKRYPEAAMLALAAIDYLTIYRTYREEREPEYKSIKKVLNKHIHGYEEDIEQVITQYTVKLIKAHYDNNNDIDDPDYVNRNRLMHGIMEIEKIKKIDCIKLIYLLDVLSSIEIHLVEK